MAPRFNFSCELDSGDLADLFAGGSVVRQLLELGASVTLGLIDSSLERAAVVRQLNAAGIPVTAWLLLPMEQGYWFNANNAELASARYDAFRAWTAELGLVWDGVGIDVEPDTREIKRFLANQWAFIPNLVRRLVDDRARADAAERGVRLVERAGETIAELSDASGQSDQAAQQIAATVRQHSVGMEQIAQAMQSVDQVTAQGLGATARARQAAEHLAGLVRDIDHALAAFKAA